MNANYCVLFSSRVRIRIRFSVWLVSCYAHVFVRLCVVTVTLPIYHHKLVGWPTVAKMPAQIYGKMVYKYIRSSDMIKKLSVSHCFSLPKGLRLSNCHLTCSRLGVNWNFFIGTKFCSKPQETCKASPEICRNIFVSEMTCIVSSGTLNSTHSLTVGTCHRRWCHSRVTSSTAALVTFQSHRELKSPILKAVSFFSRVASANKFTSFYSK